MTAITYTGIVPVVGGSVDTWGTILNTGFGQIKTDLEMLNTAPANTILGRNDVGSGEVERLTGAEVTALLDAVAGASQVADGTQGVAPKPLATQQNFVLAGSGAYRSGLGRAFGAIITTTGVNGSQPTLTGTLNVTSISTLTVAAGVATATVTFTNALPSTAFAVHVSGSGALAAAGADPVRYGSKSTTTVEIIFTAAGGEISLSGF